MSGNGRKSQTYATEREYVATQRGALVGWWLAEGEALTTRQVADLLGMTCDGARIVLEKVSAVLPIVCIEGEWQPSVMQEIHNLP